MSTDFFFFRCLPTPKIHFKKFFLGVKKESCWMSTQVVLEPSYLYFKQNSSQMSKKSLLENVQKSLPTHKKRLLRCQKSLAGCQQKSSLMWKKESCRLSMKSLVGCHQMSSNTKIRVFFHVFLGLRKNLFEIGKRVFLKASKKNSINKCLPTPKQSLI